MGPRAIPEFSSHLKILGIFRGLLFCHSKPVEITYFIVNAFSAGPFTGNPAGVCPLKKWIPDAQMQSIARENNLSETAFCVPKGDDFELRWFAPEAEVDLCGHATLATAYVLMKEQRLQSSPIGFHTKSGLLQVSQEGDDFILDFPLISLEPVPPPKSLLEGLGIKPSETYVGMDYVAVYPDEESIKNMTPHMERLKELDRRGVLVTAPSKTHDYSLRCFGPKVGIPEDPATGSAQSALGPFWGKRFGKQNLTAIQHSKRRGQFSISLTEDRIKIGGEAHLYLKGFIHL